MYTIRGAKQFRRATRLEATAAEILGLNSAVSAQRKTIQALTELNKQLIQRLSEMGLVVKVGKDGTVVFEAAKVTG